MNTNIARATFASRLFAAGFTGVALLAPACGGKDVTPEAVAPADPSSEGSDDAKLEAFFRYEEQMAPYSHQLQKIVNDNGRDSAKVTKAILADPTMMSLRIVGDRSMKRNKLTKADVEKQASFVKDARGVLTEPEGSAPSSPDARAALTSKHGPAATTLAQKHRASFKRAEDLISTQRPIDCGRQPDSCSCTECPSGPPCGAYAACIEQCAIDLAACAIQSGGAGAFVCLIPFHFCGINCQSKC